MVSAFINDGQNRDGYIAEVPRLYPAVRFIYRPMVQLERRAWAKQIDLIKDVDAKERHSAKVLAERIVSWDVSDGEFPVKVSGDNLLRLQPILLARITDIVLGDAAPDVDPRDVGSEPKRELAFEESAGN